MGYFNHLIFTLLYRRIYTKAVIMQITKSVSEGQQLLSHIFHCQTSVLWWDVK